jgi:predicted transposase YdaD
MHTDSLFYRLFQERPATVFELAGLDVPADPAYRMHAEEVKQTAFRLDGVLHRIYLTDLLDQSGLGLGARLARLLVMDEAPMVAEARALIEEQSTAVRRDPVIDLIETLLVYKFPKLTRAEIQIMLHLPETDLKKTRFYQEAYGEGEEAGEKKGKKEGESLGVKKGELAMVLRQLGRRLGSLTTQHQRQIERLSTADLGALGEALLDFAHTEDLDDWLRGKRGA